MSSHLIEIPDVRKNSDDPESQTEQAFTLIEEMIVTLEIPPGGSISEATLSAKTGIGRTPIRMALKRLEHVGLVTILPRKGVFIRQMKVEDLLAILEVRQPVEKMLAMKAARLAIPAQRALLRASVKGMVQSAVAGDLHQYLHYDQECDRIIYETSRNVFAMDFVTLLYSHSRRFWVANSHEMDWVKLAQLHWEMMNAIADGNEEKTAKSSDDLINYLETTCKAILGV